MHIAWYLGFGWRAIALFVLFGALSYRFAEGGVHWLLYSLFALVAAFMATNLRLYWREPWRRIHRKGMGTFIALLQRENRLAERDFPLLYLQMGKSLLGAAGPAVLEQGLLTEAGMRAYYRQLVADFPAVFTHGLPEDRHEQALLNMKQDIDATEVGPEVVVAVAIERRYGPREAARYLLALARGLTRQHTWFN